MTTKPPASRLARFTALSIASVVLLASHSAQAASATWSATPTNGNWEAGVGDTNWSTGIGAFPGATSGLTNADTATFNQSSTTAIAITSSSLNIKSITFGIGGGTVANAFTLGSTVGNSLLLSSGGAITVANNSGGNAMTVNAPLVLEPLTNTTAGTYTFNNAAGTATQNLIIGGSVTGGTTTQGITLTLTGSSGPTGNDVQGVISDGGAALGLSIVKTGNATWKLSNTNSSFTGGVAIQAGTLSASSIGNSGGNSSLGTNGTINIGSAGTGATLAYIGTGETTNKVINLSGTTGGATITQSGASGLLKFTSAITNTVAGNKTITLSGSTAGTGEIASNILDTGGTISLTKSGSGTWTLSGTNSYSGLTNVNGANGTLIITGSNSSAGATTVQSGTLILNSAASNGGLATGLLTFGSGGALTVSTAATLSNTVSAGFGSGGFGIAGNQNLVFNGDVTTTGNDNKGFNNNLTGGATMTLNGFLNISNSTTNTYNSGGSGTTIVNGVVRTTPAFGTTANVTNSAGTMIFNNTNTYAGTTLVSGGTLQLNVNSAISASALVLSGGTLALRSDTNNDTFGATSRTLSGNATINVDKLSTGSSNTLQLGAFNVTAATTATLTVSGGNGYGLALGAITQTPVTGTTFTIANSAPLTLASFTTNSNAATPKLSFTGTGTATITGNLTQSGSGALALDRATAPGTLILQGTSNMTGAVTITNGTIQTAVDTAFGSTSGISIGGSGVLALRADANTQFGATAYNVATSSSGATINVDQVSAATPGTTITLGTGTMGAHQLVTTGANGVSLTLGAISSSITAGTPSITNNIASPGILTIGGVAFTGNTGGTTSITFNGTGTTLVTGAVTQNLANAVALTMNNASGTTIFTGTNTNTGTNTITAGTIQVGNNTSTGSLGAGGISLTNANSSLVFKRSNAVSVANTITLLGSVTQAGASSLTLSGTSTFSGGLNINSGSVISGSATPNGGIGTGTVTMANSTMLDLGNNTLTTGLLNTSGDGTGVSITNATGTAGNKTLTISGTGTQTFAGVISNGTATSLGVTKAGAGIQNLTGANSYSGITTITGGTLAFASGSLSTTSAVALTVTGVTLKYLAGNTDDLSAKINTNSINGGAGAIIDIGGNNVTFASTISNTQGAGMKFIGTSGSILSLTGSTSIFSNGGPIVIDTIEVDLNKTGTPTYTSDVTLQNGAKYKLFGAAAGTTVGSTTPSLTINSNSTLDLNGNNYNLQSLLGDSTALITNSAASTTSTIRYTYAGTSATFNGTIQDGAGIVAVNGNASRSTNITYTGNNTYSGGTSVIADGTLAHAHTLSLGSNTALGTGALTIGSYVTVKSDSSSARTLTNDVTVTSATGTPIFGTAITGDLSFGALSTSGTPSITVDNAQTTFTSATGITGLTKLGAGTLNISGNYAASGATTITAGTLQIGGSASGNIADNAALVFDTSGSPAAYTGVISGNGTVTKSGVGTHVFSGANTYAGTTTITAGTLLVNGTHTGAGDYSVSGTLGGTGTITGATNAGITLASGAKLAPGASAGTLAATLSGTGTVDLSAAVGGANFGALVFELGAVGPGTSDIFSLTSGTLAIGSGALEFADFNFSALSGFGAGVYTLFDTASAISGTLGSSLSGTIGGFNGVLSLANLNNDLILTVSAIPEPSTWALLAFSLTTVMILRRRKSA